MGCLTPSGKLIDTGSITICAIDGNNWINIYGKRRRGREGHGPSGHEVMQGAGATA